MATTIPRITDGQLDAFLSKVAVRLVRMITKMAERVGFEPTVPGLPEHTISSRAPSANSGISPHSWLQALSCNLLHSLSVSSGLTGVLPNECPSGGLLSPPWSRGKKLRYFWAWTLFVTFLLIAIFLAERVGFEPTCPALHRTSRFRVDPVTTTSVPLHNTT